MTKGNQFAVIARRAALLLALWFTFLALHGAMQVVRAPKSLGAVLAMNFTFAALWSMLSLIIGSWHRRVRQLARTLVTIALLHIPLLGATALIDTVVSVYGTNLFTHRSQSPSLWSALAFLADFDIFAYLVVVSVSEMLLVRNALHNRQQTSQRLEWLLNLARLRYLEAQLQPHFLFNSLGAVSELVSSSPSTASLVLHQFATIFEMALETKTDEVTVREEISAVEPYISIQRIRFDDWLRIDWHVDEIAMDCLLPRFVLQPLMEEAIEHGLSGRTAAGRITISVSVEGNSLVVRFGDNGIGLDVSGSAPRRLSGFGNIRDRLSILYGDDHSLGLESANGPATVELRIPARRSSRRDEVAGPVVAPLVAIAGADMHVLTLPVVVRRRITAVPLVWLIVGAMWTQQSVVYDLLHGGLGDRTWLQIARGDMISAALWAILTVPILYLARRFPLERNRPARLGAYASAALLTPILHVALQQRFAYPEIPLSSRVWEMPLMVDIAIFCIVVVVAHHSLFAAWLRAHEAATVVLSSEVATARADVGRLQQIPRVILDSIHAVAETVHVDPSLAERQLSCLARYLRLALDSAAGPHVVQEREVALEAAVAALRTNGVYITALSG